MTQITKRWLIRFSSEDGPNTITVIGTVRGEAVRNARNQAIRLLGVKDIDVTNITEIKTRFRESH